MSASLDYGPMRLDALPWEPLGRSLDGRQGFDETKSLRAAIVNQRPRFGIETSRGTPVVKDGLTRRGAIYEYIRAHPGAHVRRMAKELRIATGDMQYHLSWLEKHGFVKTKRSGFYRFVYPAMAFQEKQEVLLGVLSRETPREILLILLCGAAMTQGDLARSLGHSQPTVSWHMDRLIQLGVVSKERTERGVVYEVVADHGDILSFVKSYHPEVWKRWAGRLANIVVTAGRPRVEEGSNQRVRLMPAAVVELIGHS